MKRIPITTPFFDAADGEALLKPLETGWVVQGPYVAAFETSFSEFTGSPYSIATTSCTTALHVALVALGIGPGDEVLVPAFTYVASANAVEYAHAQPVFCDVDPDTFNIDGTDLERRRSPRTRAIMPVHLFGLSADMEPILAFAKTHGLKVVEDAACALGSIYRGCHVGTFGDAGCFSFHPRKAITTGEGGMITTNSADVASLCRSLRDHGASETDLARHQDGMGGLLPAFNRIGFNYRMTDLQGALGVSQMAKARTILNARARAAHRYDDTLTNIPWLITPKVPGWAVHSYQAYVCQIDARYFDNDLMTANRFRNRLMQQLEMAGISVRQGTHAVHTLGYYREKYGLREADYPHAFAADRLSITLPLSARMTNEDVDYVGDQIRTCAVLQA